MSLSLSMRQENEMKRMIGFQMRRDASSQQVLNYPSNAVLRNATWELLDPIL